jgi:hypothetical protein
VTEAEDLLPELSLPPDAGPHPDEAEREARWSALNQRALLSVHPGDDASYSLYADHPTVRAELATLAAAEARVHPELEVGALLGDGHLILAVRLLDTDEDDAGTG